MRQCLHGLWSLPTDLLVYLSSFLADSCAQLTLTDADDGPIYAHACTFSPCSRKLAYTLTTAWGESDKIYQWDVQTGRQLITLDGHLGFRIYKVSILLYISYYHFGDNRAHEYSCLLLPTIRMQCCYSPDGNMILSCSEDNTLKVTFL